MRRYLLLPLSMTISAAALAAFACQVVPVSRDGTSPGRAVILQARDEHERAKKEWAWIAQHHPNAYALGWTHSIVAEHGWLYSRYYLQTTAGPTNVYFDRHEREPRE
jgi:hypothetical protein